MRVRKCSLQNFEEIPVPSAGAKASPVEDHEFFRYLFTGAAVDVTPSWEKFWTKLTSYSAAEAAVLLSGVANADGVLQHQRWSPRPYDPRNAYHLPTRSQPARAAPRRSVHDAGVGGPRSGRGNFNGRFLIKFHRLK